MIPPGGKGKVVGKVHTQGRLGENVKSITLDTSDPGARQFALQFRFKVEAPVTVSPMAQLVLQGIQGDRIEQVYVLHRPDGKPLLVDGAQLNNVQGISIQLAQVTAETADPADNPTGARAGDWRLTATLDDSSRARREAGALKLRTNHPDRAELILPVQVQIQPVIQITPAQVEFTRASGPEPAMAVVDLRHNGYRVFSVTGTKLDGDLAGVVAEVVTQPKMMVQRIRLSLPPDVTITPGRHAGTLVVSTSLKTAPTFEIPVAVSVVAPQ